MRSYPIPFNEAARLDALKALAVPREGSVRALDAITRMVRAMTGAESAMVTLVEAERQVFASQAGLEVTARSRDRSICAHVITREAPLAVADARADPVFADHPVVTKAPFLRSYVGAPIRLSNRMAVGSLCAMGTEPRPIPPPSVLARLADLADLVGHILEERAIQSGGGEALAMATDRAQMEFLRLVNHEIRTPLNAIVELSDAIELPRRVDGEVVEALRVSGALMTRLVESVLTYTELRSGSLVPKEASVPAARIVEAVRASIAPKLAEAGRPPSEAVVVPDLVLRGDPVLLTLALDCLATDVLARGRGAIRLRAAVDPGGASLGVEEVGPGGAWSPAKGAHPSRVGAASDAEPAELNLSLTRRLIELHAGELRLEGGEGPSRGVLRLPRWRVATQAPAGRRG